jgi:hypothetical protein
MSDAAEKVKRATPTKKDKTAAPTTEVATEEKRESKWREPVTCLEYAPNYFNFESSLLVRSFLLVRFESDQTVFLTLFTISSLRTIAICPTTLRT